MKILIISGGLSPKRSGGAVGYVEDLIEELTRHEHKVVYMDFNARTLIPIPHYRKTKRNRLTSYTFYNAGPPVLDSHATLEPLAQVKALPGAIFLFKRILRHEKPDLVHIQELLGFPVSMIAEIKALGIPVLFTAGDYYPICPTLKLFRYDQALCKGLTSDEWTCKRCSEDYEFSWSLRLKEVLNLIPLPFFLKHLLERWRQRLVLYAYHRHVHEGDYALRRRLFRKFLALCHTLFLISRRQCDIFTDFMQGEGNLKIMTPSRRTIASTNHQRPQRPVKKNSLLRLIALNINSDAKGKTLLRQTLTRLELKHNHFECIVYGLPEADTRRLHYRKTYTASELDDIINGADFGIVPSLWHETYGFVALEMLSRGVPVIASNRGAFREYILPEVNGLLFDADRPAALFETLDRLLMDESLRQQLWRGVREAGRTYPFFEEHVAALESYYQEVISTKASSRGSTPSDLPSTGILSG